MKTAVFYIERLWVWVLHLLMLFPLLPRSVQSVLMIGFFLISIAMWYKKRHINSFNNHKKNRLLILLFSTIFFVYAISLLYTVNLEEGVKRIVKVLPIVIFPFIFLFLCKNSIVLLKLKKLYDIYLFALTIGLLFLHFYFFKELHITEISHWQIRQEIEKLTDVHGTYMSLWLGFGIFLLFSNIEISKIDKLKKGIPRIVLIGYFIYWQITIGARTPLVMTIVLGILFFIIKNKINKGVILILSVIIIIISLFLVNSKSNIMNRVKATINFEQNFPVGDYSKEHKNITSEDIRKGIYFCSWNLVKESFWYGYGIGDVQNQLDTCYEQEFDTNTYQVFKFNSHNQYLQVLLSCGIFAFLLFLLSLAIPLYLSWQQSNYLWLFFTLFVMSCFLTENILDRHDGVIFYSLFNTILIFNSLNENEKGINS